MPNPTIPVWIQPLDTGQPNASDLNELGSMPKANFAAANQIIPITYGRDRLFGQPFVVHVDDTSGHLYLAYSFCEGQIAGFEKIIIDGNDALTVGTAYVGLKNRGFETGDKTGWDLETNQDGTVNSSVAQTDTYGMNIPVANGVVQTQVSNRQAVPAEGTTIRFKVWAQRNSSPDADCQLLVRESTTVGGSLVTGALSNAVEGDQGTAGWQLLEAEYVVPAGKAEYVVGLRTRNTGTGVGSWDFDDVSTEILATDNVGLSADVIELIAYAGTQTQQADSLLQIALAGYVDDLPGLAYIVARVPKDSTRGFPRLEAIVQGRVVFDPRAYNTLYDDDGDPLFANVDDTDDVTAQWTGTDSTSLVTGPFETAASQGWTLETADPSPAGPTYAEFIDNNDDNHNLFSRVVPVDQLKDYTVTCYAKQTGDRKNYLYVSFLDGNGVKLGGSAPGWPGSGSNDYFHVNAVFAASWTKYSFEFGPNGTGDIPATAVAMQIGGLFARDGAVGTNTTIRISDYRVYEGLAADEQIEADLTTWQFSQNPTICFRDTVVNFTGWTQFDQGIADNANENDALIDGVPRRQVGLTLAKANTIDSWMKGWRAYMGAFLNWEDGKVRVIPNRPDVEAPGAIELDNTAGTWIDMGDVSELYHGTASFTYEATFKAPTSDVTNKGIMGKKATEGGVTVGAILYLNTAGKIVARIHDGTNEGIMTSTASFDDEQYHHVAMVVNRSADTMDLIIDDVVAATQVSIASVTNTLNVAQPFRVGAQGNGALLWDGFIDEVRVWDDVRSPAELAANANSEISDPTTDASLVGYWKLNEGTSATMAIDSSRSGNDGTLAGAAVFGFGNAQVIPDGVAMHIGVDDIVKDSLKLRRRSLRAVPNSVAIDYEDSSGTRWFTARTQADSVRVTGNQEARRLSRVSLPGVHNASQAAREATERLNWYLTDLECTLTLFDEGWNLTHGSIVAVTHPIGLDAKLFRVRQSTAASGRWTVDLVEYDPAIYSDEIIADPTIPDTNLGDPLNPPTVTNLVLAEELFNYKTGTTGSRVRIQWDATNFPFLSQYLIEGYVDGVKVWQTTTAANDVVTPGVEEIVDTIGTETDYEVRVYVQSPFASGAAAIDTVTIQGKFAIPGDPTGAVATQTFADGVDLTWIAAVDIDIWRYEVRRGTTSDTWATALSLEFLEGLSYTDTGLALGTHRYFIKAIDSVKQESTNAAQADVTLSAPVAVAGLFGFEVASEVRLNWAAVTTGFVERYRIAYSDIPETFETTLDIVDTIRFSTKDVPEGTFTFKAYSVDKVGNEAATAAEVVIEVTSDADAFLADTYDFTFRTDAEPDIVANGSLTNMVEWGVRLDDLQYYVTNMADSFAVSPTDFVAADPLANYHSVGASEWLSETKDFGLLLTGSWNLTHDTVALQGVIDIALELSTDDATYVSFGGSSKGEFRYARVRITTAASPGTATSFVKSPVMQLKINVVPLEESGSFVSSPTAGVGATVNLTREYTALKEITTQPKNTIATGSAVTSIVDNIVIGPNTAIQFDNTNYLLGGNWSEVDPGTGDFTVEFWAINDGTGGTGTIVGKKNSSTSTGWEVLQTSQQEMRMTLDDGTVDLDISTSNDAFPEDGEYHHVSVRVDRTGDTCIIRIDEVDEVTGDISTLTGSLANTTNFTMGARNNVGNLYSGKLDEVRYWSDLRTPTEIDDNKDVELDMTQTQAGLEGYWRMNGTIGDTMGGSTTDDATVNGNDLTDTGAGDLTYVDLGPSSPVQKINSFDVFIFDTFGQQLAEEFQWKWKAV